MKCSNLKNAAKRLECSENKLRDKKKQWNYVAKLNRKYKHDCFLIMVLQMSRTNSFGNFEGFIFQRKVCGSPIMSCSERVGKLRKMLRDLPLFLKNTLMA